MQQRLQADKEIRITAHASHSRLNLQFNNTRSDTLRFTVKNLKDIGLRMILHPMAWQLPMKRDMVGTRSCNISPSPAEVQVVAQP